MASANCACVSHRSGRRLLSPLASRETCRSSVRASTLRRSKMKTTINRTGNKWGVRYFAPPPEGVELTLETRSDQPLVFKIVDQSYGLPSLPNSFKTRPENVIPAPVPTTDSTLVAKSFTF